jgi:hypothetical protein
MNRRAVLGGAAVAVLAAMAVPAPGGSKNAADAAATEFQLVFDGKHTPSLLHEGPFTTSASFCPSGYAVDTGVDSATETALRKFTCAGSAGAFTARLGRLPAEHGGSGTWQIVEGSGPLADLRGKGTWTSVRLSGNLTDPGSITFRSTWKGIAGFDASPPSVAFAKRTAQKLRRPKGAYRLRIVLSLKDVGGNAVSYTLAVIDPRKPLEWLATKSGTTSSGTASFLLRVRPTRRTRVLQLKIDASDSVGNAAAVATTLRLR